MALMLIQGMVSTLCAAILSASSFAPADGPVVTTPVAAQPAAAVAPAELASPVAPAAPAAAAVVDNGPLRALPPSITYQLVQYRCIVLDTSSDKDNLNFPRLVDLPVNVANSPKPPYHDVSPVYKTPARFRAITIGWVWAEPADANGYQVQRWLLLDEVTRARDLDIEVSPASYMGGTYVAPTTLDGFRTRAKQIFDAAKLSSADPPRDKTRYVIVRNFAAPINDPDADPPPDQNLPAQPPTPTPAGNGLWDGGAGWQLDGGTAGIYKPGVKEASLIGLMSENNTGNGGKELWVLKNGYVPPDVGAPVIIGDMGYSTPTDQQALGTVVGNDRRWNVIRETGTYYQLTFPNDP